MSQAQQPTGGGGPPRTGVSITPARMMPETTYVSDEHYPGDDALASLLEDSELADWAGSFNSWVSSTQWGGDPTVPQDPGLPGTPGLPGPDMGPGEGIGSFAETGSGQGDTGGGTAGGDDSAPGSTDDPAAATERAVKFVDKDAKDFEAERNADGSIDVFYTSGGELWDVQLGADGKTVGKVDLGSIIDVSDAPAILGPAAPPPTDANAGPAEIPGVPESTTTTGTAAGGGGAPLGSSASIRSVGAIDEAAAPGAAPTPASSAHYDDGGTETFAPNLGIGNGGQPWRGAMLGAGFPATTTLPQPRTLWSWARSSLAALGVTGKWATGQFEGQTQYSLDSYASGELLADPALQRIIHNYGNAVLVAIYNEDFGNPIFKGESFETLGHHPFEDLDVGFPDHGALIGDFADVNVGAGEPPLTSTIGKFDYTLTPDWTNGLLRIHVEDVLSLRSLFGPAMLKSAGASVDFVLNDHFAEGWAEQYRQPVRSGCVGVPFTSTEVEFDIVVPMSDVLKNAYDEAHAQGKL